MKLWVKDRLAASSWLALIAWRIGRKVTFGNRSDNNFWRVRNFCTQPGCFRKYTFRAWIWTWILYFFDGNQESYCRLNLPHWVTRTADSNYVPIDRRKNGSLTFCSRIWLGNIFIISRDQHVKVKISVKTYVSGLLFASRNRLESVFKSDQR